MSFPSNEAEALTMLYLQKMDIKDLSAAEIATIYQTTLNDFKTALKQEPKIDKWFGNKS